MRGRPILNSGRSPIVETGVGELLRAGSDAGRLRATSSAEQAVHAADVSMICVGTPRKANGSLDLDAILEHAEVLILGNDNPEFRRALSSRRPGQRVHDLVRLLESPPWPEGYEGICW